MRSPRLQLNIRTIMILVLISAVVLTLWGLVRRAVDPLLGDRAGTSAGVWIMSGAIRYHVLIMILTGVVALPFAVAIVLALKPAPKDQAWRRRAPRWLMAALALAIGLTILRCPLDGLRSAQRLRDGSFVCFYHQYRVWPGEHVTPCLELMTSEGKSRSYPIARNVHYRATPDVRTDATLSVIWFVDEPTARVRYGPVWCSIDRTTGKFIGAGGPYPAVVMTSAGFPPAR